MHLVRLKEQQQQKNKWGETIELTLALRKGFMNISSTNNPDGLGPLERPIDCSHTAGS